jgi:hypothetical protein
MFRQLIDGAVAVAVPPYGGRALVEAMRSIGADIVDQQFTGDFLDQ